MDGKVDAAGRPVGIVRKSLATEVADKLREKILRGELKEGEQLRQKALAEEFHVSQIPVREALRQLEAEGLVTIITHHGAIVSSLSPEEIEELFEIRAVLECAILRQAIPRLTAEDLARAEHILDAYERALDAADAESWGELHWQFHSTLYAAADRPRFMSLIQMTNVNADRYIRLHIRFSLEMHRQVKREHRLLLEYCRARDVEAATQLLQRHILNAGSELKEYIRQYRERR
ncbi:HTH-type transcriptional repressor RspR [bacterium HR10]|nr:HTH-type transcriptional repressor RspR [bacterium HR10]